MMILRLKIGLKSGLVIQMNKRLEWFFIVWAGVALFLGLLYLVTIYITIPIFTIFVTFMGEDNAVLFIIIFFISLLLALVISQS